MKPLALTVLCLLLALCAGCGAGPEPGPAPAEEFDLTVVNELETADIWLLPQTEQNLHTTVWGAATLADLGSGGEGRLSLTALGGPGVYILRGIDENGMYYAADGLTLEAGCALRLTDEEGPDAAALTVTDAAGEAASYPLFAARL